MSEIEIDVQNTKNSEPNNVQLPMNFLAFGEIEPDDTKVYIKQDVYKALEKYAVADVDHERGTIIIGDYCEELGKTHVIISDYIEAKYTDASASTLTFTHETWDYVHKEQDSKYPDKRIVGWQHTHPGYGIFLSNYDLFIHENFFNLPFQVAYVIDPVQNLRGFFQWKNGKIEKLKGYYIYDEVGKPIKIEREKDKTDKPSENRKPSVITTAVLSIVSVLVVVLAFLSISLFGKYNALLGKYDEQITEQEQLKEQLSEQNRVIKEQKDSITKQATDISDLQEQLVNALTDDTGKTTAEYLLEKIENQEIMLQNQDAVIKELQDLIKKEDDTTPDDPSDNDQKGVELRCIIHTVGRGDSLSKICKQYGIDYFSTKNIILGLNGISNPDYLYIGQKLILPIFETDDN